MRTGRNSRLLAAVILISGGIILFGAGNVLAAPQGVLKQAIHWPPRLLRLVPG